MLVVESCQGMVVGALLERMGGKHIFHIDTLVARWLHDKSAQFWSELSRLDPWPVPLSTLVNKWVLANLMLGDNPAMD